MTFGAFFTSVRRSMSDKMAAAARRGPIPPGVQTPAPVAPAPAPPTTTAATRSASTQATPPRPPTTASQAERIKEDDWNYLVIDVRWSSSAIRPCRERSNSLWTPHPVK